MNRGERLTRTASVAYTKGLLNNPGENNCFLNSAVQVLWHLDVFRRSFREFSGHFCVGESCIFCALKIIFTQIQYSDEAALPPDVLRQALAVTFKDQQRFQLQDMDDAAECLENILSQLHFHFAMNEKDEICSASHCISHRKFAMEIMEQSICNCGATSEPLPFSQLVHYVSVSALCHEADILASRLKGMDQDMFGNLLKRAVNQGELRSCPGINCGKKISVQQSLLNCPDVVCIGLIWDSECPEVEQITQLLDCIDPVLRLHEVFPNVVDDTAKKAELLLAGVVTYYGKHYSTFFKNNKLMTWVYYDDARVRKVGPDWETIRKKCCQNHYQPLLLLYVNPHGRPVNTKSAPSEVKLVDTKTLLASQEHSRSRTSFTSEKTNDRSGGTLSVLHEHKSGVDAVDGLLSSSSSHSVASDRGSEKDEEISTPDRKKSRRSMKKLRDFGSDIKRALSRSRNNSPTREQNSNTSDTQTVSSRSRNNSPIREQSNASDIKTVSSRGRNNSPTHEKSWSNSKREQFRRRNNSPSPERVNNNVSLNTEKVENVQKKQGSCDDLINLSDVKPMTRRAYSSASTGARDVDEIDSGVGSGSSQASSPATSSVSSVDTTSDDLIDFGSKTSTFPRSLKANDVHARLDAMIEEGENLLRRSYDLEKQDLALSLSLATNAATRFRIAIENYPSLKSERQMLKSMHAKCVERSRLLHSQITEKNNSATTLAFSQQEKQKLIHNQTSSVSPVDTSSDDLIDFGSRTSPFPRSLKVNDVHARLDAMIEEGENNLRRSYDLEKQDLGLSLSLATNAATRFRIAIENYPPLKSERPLQMLKSMHAKCVERSRFLHSLITEKNNNATTLAFSQQEKQKLIHNQRERDQKVLGEMKQTPVVHATLPRSKDRVHVDEVAPMSTRSVNDLYLNNYSERSSSPSTARRGNSRSVHSGSVGNSRDEINCTQKIKPDALCYSPVHYGKANGLNNDFERLNLAQDRNTTVTHVSTSYIPVRSLPVEQLLPTSTVLPNSRNLRGADIRRCSIYDNMPHSQGKELQMNSSRVRSEVEENRRSLNTPVYIEPPPYNLARSPNSKNQSASLLQRFNVPMTSRHSESVGVPEDVRRVNEGIRNSRRLCAGCGKTFVEKNTTYCRPCQQLDHLLHDLDNTAMQY